MDGMTIPLGCQFRFDPKDDEILVYLKCKSNGEPLPGEGFIKEVDLYGLNDPGVLFKGTEEKLVYVFTKLKKVAKNGKRIGRSVPGNRTWKGVDAGKVIYDAQKRPLGEKKNFVLMNKMMKMGYNMVEYSLDKEILRNSRFKDYVVCKIKKKAKKLRGLNDGNFPEEIEDSPVSTPAATEGDSMNFVSEQEYISPSSVSTPAIEGDPTVHFSEEGYICPSSVSMSAIEEVMGSVSEGGYQYGGNSIAFSQYQYQGEQAQESYQFSESNKGMGYFMSSVFKDFDGIEALMNSGFFEPLCSEDSDKALMNSVFFEPISSGGVDPWMTQTTVEESNQLSISWEELLAMSQDQQQVEEMI